MKILKEIEEEFFSQNLDHLRREYGRNKKYPLEYELPILIALSYFPELKSAKIKFIKVKSSLAFASRPSITSLFLPAKEREYQITLSTRSRKIPPELLFDQLSLNRQVGILGHELSHTSFYFERSNLVIISVGMQYLFSDYRVKFERDTDKHTIARGLGYQLLDFARYWKEHPKADEKLKAWHDKYYLHPLEILEEIKKNPSYAL